MTFKYRFAYYMGGFAIGIFFVSMMWSGKDARCNYFPNARVLNDLRTKPFQYSPDAKAVLAEKWVDTADVRNTLQYGDVDFDRSNEKEDGGKRYIVEGHTVKQIPLELTVINYEDRAVLKKITRK